MNQVTVRRRGALMAVVAVGATVLAVAYLWYFARSGGGPALLVGVALAAVGLGHALAWLDARNPLLVADDTGLRVRLGSAWTGLLWKDIERVEVDDSGRFRDGRVCVVPVDEKAALVDTSRRSRWAAAFNLHLYDAPLVVPYGLTTQVSVPDVAQALETLAGERVNVVRTGRAEVPEPMVEVTRPGGGDVSIAGPAPVEASEAGLSWASSAEASPLAASVTEPEREQPAAEVFVPAGSAETDEAAARPRRRRWAARAEATASRRPRVSSLASGPARRAEVTMPARMRHASGGGVALADAAQRQAAPEVAEGHELRRSPSESGVQPYDPDRGNVSLIIDATTDISARAMRKVRRGDSRAFTQEPAEGPPAGTATLAAGRWPDAFAGADAPPATIGGQIRDARRMLGLSVDELGERTRIRPYVIESIEINDFSPCGGDFYARGHLRMLARVLGVDAAPLLAEFDSHFASSPLNAREVFEVELATGTTGMVRGGESGTSWGALVAAVLVLMLIWGVARYFTGDGDAPTGTTSTTNAQGLGSPGAGNPDESPQGSSGGSGLPAETAHVKISAIGGDSTVVVTDGLDDVVFDSVLTAGASEKLAGQAPLTVTATDGGVVRLHVRGRDLGLLGPPGRPAVDTVSAESVGASR